MDPLNDYPCGNALRRALCHPLVARKADKLLTELRCAGPVAVYDPLGLAVPFDEILPLKGVDLSAVYVRDVQRIGSRVLGLEAEPVTALAGSPARILFVPAFDADRHLDHIRHLIPEGVEVATLDGLKLPDRLLSETRQYLTPLNFATNFAFFRDMDGRHTRLATANYWSGYGAKSPRLWLCLFAENGRVLAEWQEDVPGAGASVVVDSAEVRRRFDLPAFEGQLFIHVVGAAGHCDVRYVLDTYGDTPEVLSSSHDSGAEQGEYYAGLPAPAERERVILWVQNTHPSPIPAGAVKLNPMGRDGEAVALDREIPPFGSYALDVAELLPELRWPAQIEIAAGRHMVRPHYEVAALDRKGVELRRRMAHPNVERTDVTPDPRLAELGNLMGKGFILPAPVLPVDRFRTIALPTPMARTQEHLPLAAILYDADGTEVARTSMGALPRDHASVLDATDLLNGHHLKAGYGHVELIYDFTAGREADGWLHALFRYRDKVTGDAAETAVGAHMYNSCLTYRGEPESCSSQSPDPTTRLFLRLGSQGLDTLCHLIYPASTAWHPFSDTQLVLIRRDGHEVARRSVRIACSGSLHFRAGDLFDAAELRETGSNGYILIRDTTCRLAGYHGLIREGETGAFSLDHMFGF